MDERETQAHDEVADLEIPAQRREPGNLTRHHERLDLAFEPVALLAAARARPAFPQALDFDLTDRVGDPLRRVRLTGAEEDLGRRLGEHGFGVVAVPRLKLAASLETEDHWVVRFPVLGDRGVQLRQTLQARELVQDEPRRMRPGLPLIHQAQHQQVQPQAGERDEPRACFGRAGQEQPAVGPGRGPRRGTPAMRRVTRRGQELERIRHHVEGGEDPAPLGRRLSIDHRGVRGAGEAAVDLVFVTEPPGELFGRRPQRQQVREDAPGRFGEERVLMVSIRKERRGQCQRFSLVPPLIARRPIRTARVERVQQ